MSEQRKRDVAAWYMAQLNDRLHRYVANPVRPGTREALDQLLDDYAQAARSGSIECPRIF